VLIGSSMGGTAVLSAATRIRPPVAGVASLSGPSTFGGVDARAAIARLRVPVLLVAGTSLLEFGEHAPGSGPRSKASSPSGPDTEWRMRCGSG
jgi:alpha-beta hydrolase superfamily lysophospholipase